MATANFVVRRTLASSLTRNRSPGPGFSFGREAHGHDVDLGPRAVHQVVEPLAEQRARTVQPRGVDEDQLGVRAVHDPAYDGPGGLRLRGGDRDLRADDRVGQRGLAGVGPADEAGEAGPVARLAESRSCPLAGGVVVGPDLLVGLDPAPCRGRRSGPGRPGAPAGHGCRSSSPSRRSGGCPSRGRDARGGGSSRIWADSPAIQKYPGPSGQSIPRTIAASRLVPESAWCQVTGAGRRSPASARRAPRRGSAPGARRRSRRSAPSPGGRSGRRRAPPTRRRRAARNEPLGAARPDRVAQAVGLRPLGHQPLLVDARRRWSAGPRAATARCSSGSGTAPGPSAPPTRRGPPSIANPSGASSTRRTRCSPSTSR